MSSNQSVIQAPVQLILNDQQAINAAYQVADFALEERNKRDQNRILPTEQINQFSQKGLGGIRIPKQYGGAFVSNKTLAHAFRILSKADANVGQIPQNQFGLLNFINITGSDAQKQFIYTEILAGKRIANGGPEKNSKDTKSIQTKLTLENGQYFLNGEKFYSTGTSFADWLAIRALHPEGYTVLVIIDRHAEGVEHRQDRVERLLAVLRAVHPGLALAGVGVHEARQHPAHVFAVPGNALAVDQALERAMVVLGQLDVFLKRLVLRLVALALQAQHVAEQLQCLGSDASKQLIGLLAHGSRSHGGAGEHAAHLGRHLVGLAHRLKHAEILALAGGVHHVRHGEAGHEAVLAPEPPTARDHRSWNTKFAFVPDLGAAVQCFVREEAALQPPSTERQLPPVGWAHPVELRGAVCAARLQRAGHGLQHGQFGS